MNELGRTTAIALLGVTARLIEVEAYLAAQLPGFSIIGLPDASLGEARERVRSAAANAGAPLPTRKITVNLTPAAVPKHGSGFDLAIAMAVFVAAGVVPLDLAGTVFVGELGLDGRARPVPGIIPMVVGARDAGATRVVVPEGNLAEVTVIPGIRVEGVRSLRDAAIRFGADLAAVPEDVVRAPIVRAVEPSGTDLSDVVGNPIAVRALQVAAAGGHHMLLLGPPGAGKTMLAERLPALLPDLDAEASLEVAAVRSVVGLGAASWTTRPPWEHPHHSASAIALIGGGTGTIRPGAVSRATRGVLFLDEATEFPRPVLDALRQPLESGRITIHRASGHADFPARFQLVLAANPCPCGLAGVMGAACECPPNTVRRYLGRLSGPLLDRIDIRLPVDRVSTARLLTSAETPTTAVARRSVEAARVRMGARLAGTPWSLNAEVAGRWLRSGPHRVPKSVTKELDKGLDLGTLTMRGWDRIMRVAWTLADLDQAETPTAAHVGSALALRVAL